MNSWQAGRSRGQEQRPGQTGHSKDSCGRREFSNQLREKKGSDSHKEAKIPNQR